MTAPIQRRKKSAPRTGILATVLSGILFGTSVPIIKLGLGLLPADLFAALRFTLASVLVLLLLRRRGWVDRTLLEARPIWVLESLMLSDMCCSSRDRGSQPPRMQL